MLSFFQHNKVPKKRLIQIARYYIKIQTGNMYFYNITNLLQCKISVFSDLLITLIYINV